MMDINLQLFEDDPNNNPADGGQENNQQNNPQPENKTFTQAELDAIIAERLKREREKYKDYADLKKAAEELQKMKESQMSETEKLQAKLAEYEKRLQEKEREAEEARIEAAKIRILDELGLPKMLANRVFGKTEEEIKRDTEELKRLLGFQGKPVGSGTNPPNAGGIQQNPWKKETFNLTMQAKILRENPALAQKLMAEAGK